MDAVDATLAASGDASAFERLYRAHTTRIFNLARRMVGPEDAEELTQDVFVRAWQKLHTFRGDAAFSTWLHRLAINVLIGKRQSLGKARTRFTENDEPLERMPSGKSHSEFYLDFDVAEIVCFWRVPVRSPSFSRVRLLTGTWDILREPETLDAPTFSAGSLSNSVHEWDA